MLPLPNAAALPTVRRVPTLHVLPLLQTRSHSRSPLAAPASPQFPLLLSRVLPFAAHLTIDGLLA